MPRLRFVILFLIWTCIWHASASWADTTIKWKILNAPTPLEENIILHLQAIGDAVGQSDQIPESVLNRAILKAGKALGYYRLSYQYQKKDDTVEITVNPGDPVRWHELDIKIEGEGQNEPGLIKARDHSPLMVGSAINQQLYDDFKVQWLNKARSLGYRDARFIEHVLEVDVKSLHANVRLVLQTGTPYFVESVRFDGSQMNDDLLDKLVPFDTGERYQSALLSRLYSRLLDTAYFEQITILPVKTAPKKMSIEVSLVDSAPHIFTTGLGFSSDTGPRIRLGWDRQIVGSKGHQLHNSAKLSTIEQNVSSEYLIPVTSLLDNYFALTVGWQHRQTDDTDSKIWEASMSHHTIWPDGWHHSYKLGIENEKYRQGRQPSTELFYVIPGDSWSHTRLIGDSKFPDGGHKIWIGVEGSTAALGSDTDFFKVASGVKWFTLFAGYHEFHTRLELGAITAGDFTEVPVSRRFFTGGDQTVRGFDYESLAPKDSNDDLMGGRFLNVASMEYRWRWRSQWFLALFTDVGRAYNTGRDDFHQGAGFGVHWQSPVGPIRFDIAKPVADNEQNNIQLHITMGPPV